MHPENPELDLEAFNRIFNEYQQRFIRFAVTYTSDTAIAEDIVMDGFMAAWENRSGLTGESFPAYTLTAIRNKCLNHLRSKAVHERVRENIHSHSNRVLQVRIATLEACDPEELFTEETRALVHRALESLPPHTREIFTRSRIDGESYKEIASSLGITVKSVEFELTKAAKLLRVVLKNYRGALLLILGI